MLRAARRGHCCPLQFAAALSVRSVAHLAVLTLCESHVCIQPILKGVHAALNRRKLACRRGSACQRTWLPLNQRCQLRWRSALPPLQGNTAAGIKPSFINPAALSQRTVFSAAHVTLDPFAQRDGPLPFAATSCPKTSTSTDVPFVPNNSTQRSAVHSICSNSRGMCKRRFANCKG